MNDIRINARVDEATQRQVAELVRATGRTTSDVVRAAIALYYAQVRKERPPPKRLLAMVGKYQSRDGRTDVSTNYKQVIAESLADKYNLAPEPKFSRKP